MDDCSMSLFGVANLTRLRSFINETIVKGTTDLEYAIVFGLQVSTAVLDTMDNCPNLMYKHHYQQLNRRLDLTGQQILEWIIRKGYKALPIPSSQTMDRTQTQAHFSHRHAAIEAGLGFWGKNTLLVTPEFGAQVRISSILTDMPLIPYREPDENLEPLGPNSSRETNCKNCRACIDVCPGNALSDDGFDFDKCFEQLRIFKGQWGMGQYICGLCIKACKGTASKGTASKGDGK